MPLTPFSKVYKNFPSAFADDLVTLNNKRRLEGRKNGTNMGKKEMRSRPTGLVRPISPSPRDVPLTTKRSNTPLSAVSDGESDNDNSPRNLSKERRKRESPRPSEDSFNSTWELLYRPKVSRQTPCTTVSLDTVDLWEDSDSDGEQPPEYDLINGVAINPRHTVDLAVLRRARIQVKTPKKPPRVTKTDVPQEKLPHVVAGQEKSRENVSLKPRVRVTRKMRGIFSPPPLSNVVPENSNSTDIYRHVDAKQTVECRLRRSKSDLTRPVQTGMLRESNSADTHRVQPRGQLDDISHPGYELQRRKTFLAMRAPTPPTDQQKVKDKTKDTISPPRKVQFNNFVTIQDGETSKTDTLRNSNNSAQMYKQMYLGQVTPGSQGSQGEGHKTTKSPWRIQLAY